MEILFAAVHLTSDSQDKRKESKEGLAAGFLCIEGVSFSSLKMKNEASVGPVASFFSSLSTSRRMKDKADAAIDSSHSLVACFLLVRRDLYPRGNEEKEAAIHIITCFRLSFGTDSSKGKRVCESTTGRVTLPNPTNKCDVQCVDVFLSHYLPPSLASLSYT